jgi:hypothetical protein
MPGYSINAGDLRTSITFQSPRSRKTQAAQKTVYANVASKLHVKAR